MPNPCPNEAFAPVPVYLATLNPLVVLAETVEFIEPAVLDLLLRHIKNYHKYYFLILTM